MQLIWTVAKQTYCAAAASENVDEVQECLGYKKTNNKNYDQKCHHEIISKDDDLVHVVDNQPQGRLPSRDIVHVTNVKHKLSAAPYLELSLKRYEGTFPEKQECGGSNIWNHSSSSAFSLWVFHSHCECFIILQFSL